MGQRGDRGVRGYVRDAALAVVVALLQFRILILLFGARYKPCIEAAEGVLSGEPHWRVYQNRLLGPWLAELTTPLFGSFQHAHVFVSILLLAASGYVLLRTLRNVHDGDESVDARYFLFALLVVACLRPPWLYIWDVIDLLVFITFNAFVLQRRGDVAFIALFAVAIFNRESAYFIAAWLMLDPIVRWWLDRRGGTPGRFDLRRAATGAVLLAAGVGLVEALRSALLKREVGPEIVGDVAGAGPHVHLMLSDNLDALQTALTTWRYVHSFLIPVGLAAFVYLCVRVLRTDTRDSGALALVHGAMLAALFVFGILFETRIYLALIPFVAFQALPAARTATR